MLCIFKLILYGSEGWDCLPKDFYVDEWQYNSDLIITVFKSTWPIMKKACQENKYPLKLCKMRA